MKSAQKKSCERVLNNKFWLLITPFFGFFLLFKLHNRRRNGCAEISAEKIRTKTNVWRLFFFFSSLCLARTMRNFFLLRCEILMIKFLKTKLVWICMEVLVLEINSIRNVRHSKKSQSRFAMSVSHGDATLCLHFYIDFSFLFNLYTLFV